MPRATRARPTARTVERAQTGFRMEKRLLKVLKALAEALDLSLGDLMEGIVLHALEGKAPFSAGTRRTIAKLKQIYGLDLAAQDSHRLQERRAAAAPRGRRAATREGEA